MGKPLGSNTVRGAARHVLRQKHRIAIILPAPYGDGTLRSTKQLAEALLVGSRNAGDNVEIVLAYLDAPAVYESTFSDLPPAVKRRRFQWRLLQEPEIGFATAYGLPGFERHPDSVAMLPDDAINNFLDCDLWIIISDRLPAPLLPLRPYVMVVRDYVQRYEPTVDHEANLRHLSVAHKAKRVFVTSAFTLDDAKQYAGLPDARLRLLPPMLPRLPPAPANRLSWDGRPYFIWPTGVAPHKNHDNAAFALRRYFDELDGQLDCRMTGVETADLLAGQASLLEALLTGRAVGRGTNSRLYAMGKLPGPHYAALLQDATFLWHPSKSGGSFAVIEAAMRGTPSLSNGYPTMREIDAEFALGLSWMDQHDPIDMANRLKAMESQASSLRQNLPSDESLERHSAERLSAIYWQAIRECL